MAQRRLDQKNPNPFPRPHFDSSDGYALRKALEREHLGELHIDCPACGTASVPEAADHPDHALISEYRSQPDPDEALEVLKRKADAMGRGRFIVGNSDLSAEELDEIQRRQPLEVGHMDVRLLDPRLYSGSFSFEAEESEKRPPLHVTVTGSAHLVLELLEYAAQATMKDIDEPDSDSSGEIPSEPG